MAHLASALYLLVHSLPQEDRYDTDDASVREIYAMLVPASTLCPMQSLRHRHSCASLLDRQGQAHRTGARHPVPPGVLRAGRHLEGAEQAARSAGGTVAAMAAVGARVQTLPLVLTDGGQADPAARLQVGGVV